MKTLIINGSPRKNGHTAALISEIKKNINSDVIEISAYYDNIKPCNDCRFCWQNGYCKIDDDMQIIYNDDFKNVIIASPLYMSNLTGPLVCLASRFQAYYASKRFLNKQLNLQEKNAALFLVGGGDGGAEQAIKLSKLMFKYMNAKLDDENVVFSLNTDNLPAIKDVISLQKVKEIAERLNNY